MSKILVATDFGATSSMALHVAGVWANKMKKGIILVHVDDKTPLILSMAGYGNLVEEKHYPDPVLGKKFNREFHDQISAAKVPAENVETVVLLGRAEECIHHFIQDKRNQIDMMFLGERKKRFLDFPFLGTFNEKMVQISPMPLLIFKENCRPDPKNILLACDFSPMNERALDWVIQLGKVFDSKIHLLHFLEMPFEDYISDEIFDPGLAMTLEDCFYKPRKIILQEKLEKMKTKVTESGADCETHLQIKLNGSIEDDLNEILDERDIDLLVLGKNSDSRKKRFKNSIGGQALKLGRHSLKSLAIFN